MNRPNEWVDLPTFTSRLKILLVISLCIYAEMGRDIPRHGIDPEVAPHVEQFDQLAQLFIKDFKMPPIDIGLGDTRILPSNKDDSVVVGFCNPWGSKLMVVFDRRFWMVSTYLEREELVFHELGHCILNRPHINDRLSIMYPEALSEAVYAPYRLKYITELFANSGYNKSAFNVFFTVH